MKTSLILIPVLTLSIFASNTAYADTFVPTPCITFTHNLSFKSNDTQTDGEVSALQTFLQDEGYLRVDPTGFFGLATLRAVKKFQSTYSIPTTGYVGTLTRKKMKVLSCESFVGTIENNSTSSLSGISIMPTKPFVELLPTVIFTFPAASSTLQMGQSYDITWNTSDASHINYVIHLVGGTYGYTDVILGNTTAGSKSFTWKIPATFSPGNMYKLAIETEQGAKSVSQAFTLIPPAQNTPIIKNLSSLQGRSGDRITINGSNFSTRVTLSLVQLLKDNKVVAVFDPSVKNPYAISIDGTQIHFIVDPVFAANAEAGTYQLRVANPFGDGYAYSNIMNFSLLK